MNRAETVFPFVSVIGSAAFGTYSIAFAKNWNPSGSYSADLTGDKTDKAQVEP
jgi:hypothetical protein